MPARIDASLFDQMRDGIVVLDRRLCCVFANTAAGEVLGRRPDQLIGTPFAPCEPDAADSLLRQHVRRALAHREPAEFEDHLTPLERWYTIRVFPSAEGCTITLQDSSARHAADRALASLLAQSRRQQRLAAVLAEINEAVFRSATIEELFCSAVGVAVEHGGFVLSWIGVLDPTGGTLLPAASAGAAAADYLAAAHVTAREEPAGFGPGGSALRLGREVCANDIPHDENMAPWRDAALRAGIASSGAFPLRVGGGIAGLLSVYAAEPDFFDTEEITLVRRLAANVSFGWESLVREAAWREAEVARRADQRFRTVLAAAPTAIVGMDATGRLELVNRHAEHLFGRSATELSATSADELLSAPPGEMSLAAWRSALQGATRPVRDGLAFAGQRRDGGSFPAEVALSVVEEDGSAPLFLAAIQDVTERLQLEEERRQRVVESERERADRLDSLGKLAGGVAHDFNNVLGVILNYATLLERHAPDAQWRADLGEIRAAAERGAALTGQLLAFARRDPARPEPLELNECVDGLRAMLSRILGSRVTLHLDLGEPPLVVVLDRHQLDQVLLNLAINARDAMPDGGTLTIRTARAAPGGANGDRAPGGAEMVELSVTDTGTGMTPEVARRAVEPFFTTKERGKGTGLGLAAVYGIAQRGGGSVAISSALGHGTTITVSLPRSREKPHGEEPERTPGAPTYAAGACILLVEDDAAVRQATRRVLEGAGYRVRCAGDGDEALARLAHEGAGVSLVLSDVGMANMRGDELAEIIATRRPELPVLLMTGYDSAKVSSPAAVLRKPVAEHTLLQAVREAIDG